MHSGVPLTDEDRWPWLHGIAAWIDATRRVGNHGTIACSALKRAYRDILLGNRPDVRLVYLKGEEDLIAVGWRHAMGISCRPRYSTANSQHSKSRRRTNVRSLFRSFRIRAGSSRRS
jgi:hypothetical protein